MLSSIVLLIVLGLRDLPAEPTLQGLSQSAPALVEKPVEIQADPLDPWFAALGTVESNNNDSAVGDAGKALGRYQIHKVYWLDAVQHKPSLRQGKTYSDVTDPAYAREVILAYMDRYAKKALASRDYELLSRTHNSGPGAVTGKQSAKARANSLAYWAKVNAVLSK